MPDFTPYVNVPTPVSPNSNRGINDNPIPPNTQLGKAREILSQNIPDFVKSSQFTTPYRTQLDQTLIFTDPNRGWNPFDKNLEDEYAHDHPWATIGHGFEHGVAKFLGAAVEAIATIPMAINAIGKGDASKFYDNDLTNTINDWWKSLDISAPVFQSNAQKQGNFFSNIFGLNGFAAFAGSLANTADTVGFMGGAIAGAALEGNVLGLLTKGWGVIGATEAASAMTKIGEAAEIAVKSPEEVAQMARLGWTGTKELEQGASGVAKGMEVGPFTGNVGRFTGNVGEFTGNVATRGGVATTEAAAEGATQLGETNAVLGEGRNLHQGIEDPAKMLETEKTAQMKQIVAKNATRKIVDATKYNLQLLTAAGAQAAIQGLDVYNNTKKQLQDTYFGIYGRNPTADENAKIEQQAKQGANFTVGANIALMYFTTRINWGSLFKPTTKAFTEGIEGWGGKAKRVTAKGEFVDQGTDAAGHPLEPKYEYKVVDTYTPSTRIEKVLLNTEKLIGTQKSQVVMGAQMGLQTAIAEGSQDYITRKYSPQNLAQVGDFMKSFNNGLNKAFGTKEGWDNIIGGVMGGIAFHGLTLGLGKITGQKNLSHQEQLQQQVQFLNKETFAGTLENAVQEAAVNNSLGQEHKKAIDEGDTYKAKNIKQQMLFNWVTSGMRANAFDKRLNELDAAKHLEGKSFSSYWGVEDTAKNRENVAKFIEDVKGRAENIKQHVEKVVNITRNPHQPGTLDYKAYEEYKEALALNLSVHDDNFRRLNDLKDHLSKIAPMIDINKAVNMTSVQGLSKIMDGITKVTTSLAEQIKQTAGDDDLQKDLFDKKNHLDKLASKLRDIIYSGEQEHTNNVNAKGEGISSRTANVKFVGKDYVDVMHDLWKLHNGISYENNAYLDEQKKLSDGTIHIQDNKPYSSDDDLADTLEKLQDMYKLSEANSNIAKYYTYLRKGVGETRFTQAFKDMLDGHKAFENEDGTIKTQPAREEEIRQQEYEGIVSSEDLTADPKAAEKRDIIKKAAKKSAYGQELTPEEQKVKEEYEDDFTAYHKAETNVKERVAKEFSEEAQKTQEKAPKTDADGVPRTNANKQFDGATPENLLFGLHRNKFLKIEKLFENLHNLVFNTPLKEIGTKFSAVLTKRPAETKRAEGQNMEPIDAKNPNIKIWRKDFDEVIQIHNDGKVVGEVRPPESLYLDKEGKTPLFDKDGKLAITEQEYADVTGNHGSTYKQFKDSMEAYKQSYDKLKADVQNGKADAATIAKYFNYSLNLGTTVQNSRNHIKSDTPLNEVKVKNKSLISIVKENGKYIVKWLKDFGEISAEDKKAIEKTVANNQDHFKQFENKMMVAFPVGGEAGVQQFVRARYINEKDKSYNSDKIKVVTSPEVFDNFTINFRPKAEGVGNAKTKTEKKAATEPKLPQDLAGAKPKYGYGQKLFDLNFESDVDKAAFISSQAKQSKRDADYVKFAMEHTGLSEQEVRKLGQQIRDNIKKVAKDKEDDGSPIDIEKTYKDKEEKQPFHFYNKLTKDDKPTTDIESGCAKIKVK